MLKRDMSHFSGMRGCSEENMQDIIYKFKALRSWTRFQRLETFVSSGVRKNLAKYHIAH